MHTLLLESAEGLQTIRALGNSVNVFSEALQHVDSYATARLNLKYSTRWFL